MDTTTPGTPGTPRTLRVHQKTWEAEGVTSLTLVDPAGTELPTWEPGSHLSLRLPGGLAREYSLCSDPADASRWCVAVLRTPDSRGGSRLVHEGLPVGAVLEVDGPRHHFGIDADASRHVLVAGGIGITPIIAMVRELHARGADWQLLYAGRSRATMAFLDEIAGLPPGRVTVHADDEAAGGFPDLPGLLGTLEPSATAYACGPESLMQACAEALPDPGQLRIERFKAPEPVVTGEDDEAFDVVLNSTGERVRVDADVSILEALETAGLDVPSSCTEGICGTCEVGVLAGDIDHRDFLFTDEEHAAGKSMAICVSRCRSPELILDL
jgi:ferredoxin-NADP reductase